MTSSQQAEVFLYIDELVEKIFEPEFHPALYDRNRLSRLIIKHELTQILLESSDLNISHLPKINDILFEVLAVNNGYQKLIQNPRKDIKFEIDGKTYDITLMSVNYYLKSSGHETLDRRNDRVNIQLSIINEWLPVYFTHLPYPGKKEAYETIKKILWRLPVEHIFIEDADFAKIFNWLLKQWLNKNTLFSTDRKIQLETYQVTTSRPFIIKHPSHYALRSHPAGDEHSH